jgi:hypothetical protein
MIKLIIFGGREYADYENVKSNLDRILQNITEPIEIVSGRCNQGEPVHVTDEGVFVCGADGLGEKYAKEKGYPVKPFPADWEKYGKTAGWVRNNQMGDYGTHAVGFWDGISKGTKMMFDIAVAKKLKVKQVMYEPKPRKIPISKRTTKSKITELKENEIFVFGSNTGGIHGKGAAKTALKFGAKMGVDIGMEGQTFAIPTRYIEDKEFKTLPIEKIKEYVNHFIAEASGCSSLTFLVTEIGCGLAGYEPKDIAPLFKEAINIENIHLPRKFWKELNQQ